MSGFDEFIETLFSWHHTMSVGTIRKWRAAGLEEAGVTLTKHRDMLTAVDGDLPGSKPPSGWTGDAAEAAAREHGVIARATRELTAEVSAVRRGTLEAADAVAALVAALTETEQLARSHGFTISDDGCVIDTNPPRDVPREHLDEVKRQRTQARNEAAERLEALLHRAFDIDQDLAAVLREATKDTFDTESSRAADAGAAQAELRTLEPPILSSPAENAAWWDSLSEQERRQIITQHPEWVGNLNGIPATVRDKANRARLDAERDRRREKIARIKTELPDTRFDPYNRRHNGELLTELEAAQRKLEAVNALERTLSDESSPRQLLLLDNSGEAAKAAVAIGNVDKADHVAVFTPGFESTVSRSIEGYVWGMERLRDDAQQQALIAGNRESVTTVAWLGYDIPQSSDWSPDDAVYNDAAAKQGGQALADFYRGINAARDTDPHLTALGHSYGSTTTGYAVQQSGTGVDAVAFFGSPGIGTGDVSEIKVPDGSIYNLEARDDEIADIGWFGRDPSAMAGVTDLSTKESHGLAGDLQGSTSHLEYLDRATTSQYNLAAIVSGNEQNLIKAWTSRF